MLLKEDLIICFAFKNSGLFAKTFQDRSSFSIDIDFMKRNRLIWHGICIGVSNFYAYLSIKIPKFLLIPFTVENCGILSHNVSMKKGYLMLDYVYLCDHYGKWSLVCPTKESWNCLRCLILNMSASAISITFWMRCLFPCFADLLMELTAILQGKGEIVVIAWKTFQSLYLLYQSILSYLSKGSSFKEENYTIVSFDCYSYLS